MAKKNSIRERTKSPMVLNQIRQKGEYSRLLGEYIGTLKGILFWEIPEELVVKLEAQIKAIENEK